MATDVQVPALGESITEGTLAQWLKKPGEAVAADEPIASLETDKVSVEVPSPVAGVLTEQLVEEGDTVAVGAVIARIDQNAAARRRRGNARRRPRGGDDQPGGRRRNAGARGRRRRAGSPIRRSRRAMTTITTLSPAVRRAVLEYHVDPTSIRGSGKDGRLTKDDVIAAAAGAEAVPAQAGAQAPQAKAPAPEAKAPPPGPRPAPGSTANARKNASRCRASARPSPAPQGSAEHRRDADDVQRRRHERGDRRPHAATRICSRRSTASAWASWASS